MLPSRSNASYVALWVPERVVSCVRSVGANRIPSLESVFEPSRDRTRHSSSSLLPRLFARNGRQADTMPASGSTKTQSVAKDSDPMKLVSNQCILQALCTARRNIRDISFGSIVPVEAALRVLTIHALPKSVCTISFCLTRPNTDSEPSANEPRISAF